jgi:hypothetical protein
VVIVLAVALLTPQARPARESPAEVHLHVPGVSAEGIAGGPRFVRAQLNGSIRLGRGRLPQG